MKLTTITLAHAEAAPLLADALASAAWADEHLVIDTSPNKPEVKKALDGRPNVRFIDWPWKEDFSAARNFSLQTAGKDAQPGDWGIVLDSDERLHLDERFDLREALAKQTGDVLLVGTRDGKYLKDRFFQLPVTSAIYVGPTHETVQGWKNRQTLHGVRFSELGKSYPELQKKWLRDERILLAHTKRNPRDARWFYYLGDTYANLAKRQAAIGAFNRCAALRGWNEESAWACFRSAEQSVILKDYDAAVETCGRGLARHSGIGELAWLAGVASAWAGRHDQAIYWARLSVSLGMYTGCGARVPRIYFRKVEALYELPFDVIRHSASGDEKVEAERQFNLAKEARYGKSAFASGLDRRADVSVLYEARHDSGRAAKPLAALAPSFRMNRLAIDDAVLAAGDAKGYRLSNPSVAVHDGQLLAVVRSVNYTIAENGSYIMPPEDHGVIKTQNFLAEIDPDSLGIRSVRHLRDNATDLRFPSQVIGYEDLRLISHKGRLFASATVRDRIADFRAEIALLELDEEGVQKVHVQRRRSGHEKNWMPITGGATISFLYSCDPTVVLRVNADTQRTEEVGRFEPKYALDHLRGSSQLVPLPGADGFVGVTHEVIYLDNKRIYLHRFVQFDRDCRIERVSDPWIFHQLGIEFCAGLACIGDQFVLSYGVGDCEARLASVTQAEVIALLSPKGSPA